MPAPSQYQRGFTLVEMLVYIVLLAVLGAVLTLAGSHIIKQSAHAQLTAQVLGSARGALEDMGREIRHARGVYTPTSVFDTNPGQLSLATRENVPADEEETYVDFYIDDERLYRKREGEAAELITSERAKITNLVITHLNENNGGSALRIELTAEPAATATEAVAQASVTLVTTISLRSI